MLRCLALSLASLALLVLASCDQLASLSQSELTDPPVPQELFPLHRALEKGASAGQAATVAVLAVVHQSRIGDPAATAASPEPASETPVGTEALRMERLVRQELNKGFVRNRKLQVIQADEALIMQAQAEVLRVNSAALSSAMAKDLAARLHVSFVVCAVIEEDGNLVNVACQQATDGSLVFQDSIRNWKIFTAPEAGEAGA